MLNYIDQIAKAIATECGYESIGLDDERLLRIYAVLALTLGEATTNQAVHDAWSAWKSEYNPLHKSLIPFKELTPDVQELDTLYRDAIISVSRRILPVRVIMDPRF